MRCTLFDLFPIAPAVQCMTPKPSVARGCKTVEFCIVMISTDLLRNNARSPEATIQEHTHGNFGQAGQVAGTARMCCFLHVLP